MVSDIRQFCRLFYQMTAIPIHYHSTKKESAAVEEDFTFPQILADHSIFQGDEEVLSGLSHCFQESNGKSPDYYVSPSFSYFGFVYLANQEAVFVVGPVFSTPASEHTVRSFMKEWAVSLTRKEEIQMLLSSLPTVSFHRFLNTLAYLEFCVNDHMIDVSDHFGVKGLESSDELSRIHSEKVYESRESQNYHNTWDFEQKMLRLVQNGEPEKLKLLLEESADLSTGVLADNALRQRKNILITEIAIVTRSAILGGMDMEEAYQLADVYIMDCEHSLSLSRISNLEYTLLIDFAERVARCKIPEGMSAEIYRCIQYIRKNVNAPTQTSDVAEYLGRSRSWLSTRFKKEMGFELKDYIMRCKLEEARSLLQFSDKSLSEISAYLCFSSQSYFQNVFRKKYGITPKKYREKVSKDR